MSLIDSIICIVVMSRNLDFAYIVVLFKESNEVAVVPNLWLKGKDKCVWPNYSNQIKTNNAVIHRQQPGNWDVFSIKVLYSTGRQYSNIKSLLQIRVR